MNSFNNLLTIFHTHFNFAILPSLFSITIFLTVHMKYSSTNYYYFFPSVKIISIHQHVLSTISIYQYILSMISIYHLSRTENSDSQETRSRVKFFSVTRPYRARITVQTPVSQIIIYNKYYHIFFKRIWISPHTPTSIT